MNVSCCYSSAVITFSDYTEHWKIFNQVCDIIAWQFDQSISYSKFYSKQMQLLLSIINSKNCNKNFTNNCFAPSCASMVISQIMIILWLTFTEKIIKRSIQDGISWFLYAFPGLSESFDVDGWVVKVSPGIFYWKNPICKEMPSRVAGWY